LGNSLGAPEVPHGTSGTNITAGRSLRRDRNRVACAFRARDSSRGLGRVLINAQIAAQVPPTAFINGLHCQSTPSAHIGRLNVSAPLSKRERMKWIRCGSGKS